MINETIEKLIEKNKRYMLEGDYIGENGLGYRNRVGWVCRADAG